MRPKVFTRKLLLLEYQTLGQLSADRVLTKLIECDARARSLAALPKHKK